MTKPKKLGRPFSSKIRQNIVDILYYMQKGHGYDICKVYVALFPKVSQRVIYYHLKRGVELEEFKVEKVTLEKGDFSWGSHAEKIYYSLGSKASPRKNERIDHYLKIREIKI